MRAVFATIWTRHPWEDEPNSVGVWLQLPRVLKSPMWRCQWARWWVSPGNTSHCSWTSWISCQSMLRGCMLILCFLLLCSLWPPSITQEISTEVSCGVKWVSSADLDRIRIWRESRHLAGTWSNKPSIEQNESQIYIGRTILRLQRPLVLGCDSLQHVCVFHHTPPVWTGCSLGLVPSC